MTLKETERVVYRREIVVWHRPGGRRLFVRVVTPDAKWTADMKGCAVVQPLNPDGSGVDWVRVGQSRTVLAHRRSLKRVIT